tara:strand:+ start:1278 stop:1481 length:204 start_codon:yes stop_codon:yes gene_type:complete
MNETKLDYNKKMVGQRVEVVQKNHTWFGEIKQTVDDHSFLIRDDSNRDNIVSMYDVRSVEMSQLAQV